MSNSEKNYPLGNQVADAGTLADAKVQRSLILTNNAEIKGALEDLIHLVKENDVQGCLLTILTEVQAHATDNGMDSEELEDCTYQLLKLSQVFNKVFRHAQDAQILSIEDKGGAQ